MQDDPSYRHEKPLPFSLSMCLSVPFMPRAERERQAQLQRWIDSPVRIAFVAAADNTALTENDLRYRVNFFRGQVLDAGDKLPSGTLKIQIREADLNILRERNDLKVLEYGTLKP